MKKTLLALALCSATFAFAQTAPVKPGDDFFTYANADWLAKTEIPADRSTWSAMGAIAESTNQRIVKMIEELAKDKKASGEARQVADFYTAFMDEAGIEAKGLAPIKPVLAKIDSIKDKAGLVKALGSSLRADVDVLNATNLFTENLFGLWVTPGLEDTAHNTPYLLQGGLGMPDRAYYLSDSPKMADLRTKYQAYIATMLGLAGYDNAEARAARVFELEMGIAKSHVPREDSSDVLKGNNKWNARDFAAKAPGIDWSAFFKAAKLDGAKTFIVWHPSAIIGSAALVGATDLATWKDFLAFHQLNHFAGTLPKAFADASFAFNGKAMLGTPEQRVRWKRALSAANAGMDEAVGKVYVSKNFAAEDKARIQKMVANIVAAFSARVEKLDWMAPATRAEAQAKLKTLYVGIAYPDHWSSYAGLKVSPTDALGNAMRAEQFHYAQQVAKLHQKPNRTEWCMPPQLVNAVNLPLQNALNFPAAILQAPIFDPKASDATNYGAIGTIIGHEVSHSFDDQGSQFDSKGRLRDWWTPADMEHFKKASAALAAQYSAYKPYPDLAINGQQTLGENLADLAGVAAAHDALVAANGGKASLETDREFFMGFAHAWRSKLREGAMRQAVLADGHSPAPWRIATLRNIDAWYKAYDVQPGDALYLAPTERVRVW
ncbi:MAG: M13 family metallopeptidase [Pseudomonadota bacterium]